MRYTLCVFALMVSSAAADEWVLPPLPVASGEPCVADYVYKIRATGIGADGRTYIDTGCGVAISAGQLQTVSHLAHGLRNATYEVETTPGTWLKVSAYVPVPNEDLAFVTVNASLNHTKRRKAVYGEKVFVYGQETAITQPAVYSDTDTASVEPGLLGAVDGDSGGGVFGEDGALLGTVRGHNKLEARAVKFTVNPPLPASPQLSSNPLQLPAKAPSAPVQNCPNGQCGISPSATQPQPRYGIFGRYRGSW